MEIWEDLGAGCLDSSYDLGALGVARYIKLVDETNPEDFGGVVDGFDVDGLMGQCRENVVPEFGVLAGGLALVGALGGFLLLRKR